MITASNNNFQHPTFSKQFFTIFYPFPNLKKKPYTSPIEIVIPSLACKRKSGSGFPHLILAPLLGCSELEVGPPISHPLLFLLYREMNHSQGFPSTPTWHIWHERRHFVCVFSPISWWITSLSNVCYCGLAYWHTWCSKTHISEYISGEKS